MSAEEQYRLWLERIEIKIVLKQLPTTYAEYPWYRFQLAQKVRSCGLPGTIFVPFLRQLQDYSLDELKVAFRSLDSVELNLESKLFTAVGDILQDKKYLPLQQRIMGQCDEGAGRQAVKILDRHFQFTQPMMLNDAADAFDALSCNSMAELGPYLTGFRYHMGVMEAGGQTVNEAIVLSRLKRTIRPYMKDGLTEIAATYSQWEA